MTKTVELNVAEARLAFYNPMIVAMMDKIRRIMLKFFSSLLSAQIHSAQMRLTGGKERNNLDIVVLQTSRETVR